MWCYCWWGCVQIEEVSTEKRIKEKKQGILKININNLLFIFLIINDFD